MSFTSSSGTRGAKQPRNGLFMRLINRMMSRRIRNGGKLMGNSDGLVLKTVGRKSGEPRSNPVNYFPGPNGSWLIVASAAGAPKNPDWYHNIAANPDRVQIELPGRTVSVRAEQLHGEERESAWRQITQTSPLFARYATKTDRELPIIRLTEQTPTS
ncbi:nitroreductase/quinone reductase family protein [Mycolicibacterium litorale]|uniref:nitroreductase/quinone reductase family protein n=1 Tax=Mycolicibacterium litorale TaxID=758802 RepID=UPI003CF8EC07